MDLKKQQNPTYTQADLHTRPDHDILAVGVGFQVPNGEDADYLDHGHEEAESKQASQEGFLFEAELEFPKDWQRQCDDYQVQHDACASKGEVEWYGIDTTPLERSIPLFCDLIDVRCSVFTDQ